MESTLLVGERILVSKLIYKVKAPKRGEVVVFVPPHDETKIFVKRIVALEGDTVETRGEVLYVNGDAIDDSGYTQHIPSPFKRDFPPFFDPRHIPDGPAFDNYKFSPAQFRVRFPDGKPFVVPKGHIFAIGDNRDQSADSRVWGPVPIENIKGRGLAIYWSSTGLESAKSWEIWKIIRDIQFDRIGRSVQPQFDG